MAGKTKKTASKQAKKRGRPPGSKTALKKIAAKKKPLSKKVPVKKQEKHPGGRPSKLTNDLKKQMQFLAEKGFTEIEIASALLINPSTITKWKQKFPEFFTSLKDWKKKADQKVERALFERACGYSHPEDKIFRAAGEKEATIVPTIKHYPPDPTAMIFWLKNRQPKKWRDKTESEIIVKDRKFEITFHNFHNDEK